MTNSRGGQGAVSRLALAAVAVAAGFSLPSVAFAVDPIPNWNDTGYTAYYAPDAPTGTSGTVSTTTSPVSGGSETTAAAGSAQYTNTGDTQATVTGTATTTPAYYTIDTTAPPPLTP